MTLRPVGPTDAAALAEVHASAFEDPWSQADFARFLDDAVNFARTAKTLEGEVAGFILCRIIAGEAEILTLAVRPARRRRGLAAALIAEAMAIAAPRCQAMFLEVAADNLGAIALYEQAGFEAVGRRAGYYGRRGGGSVDAIVMRRAIPSGA